MKDAIREFDAHIYYALENRDAAAGLREEIASAFGGGEIRISRLWDRPVGPHPLPMFELNFKRESFEAITAWLAEHRGSLSVLVHEVTGDDPRDHTEGARWLGPAVALDFSRLSATPGALASARAAMS